MGVTVNVEQVRRVDRGVYLGRRQAGMAEQLLQRAQVGAAAEQMGGEAVAQRMGSHPFADACHRQSSANTVADEALIKVVPTPRAGNRIGGDALRGKDILPNPEGL